MTAIDTFADLIRTLDANPQLREELRVRILPREILELPQQLAALAAVTEEHKQASARQFAALNKQVSALDQKVEEYQQANARHFAALNQKVSNLDQKVEEYQEANARQFAALNQKVEANTQQISALNQKVEANTQQISALDQKVEDYQQANERQFDALNQKVATNSQQISDLDQKVEDYQQANERHFRQIEDSLKYLKASHARSSALRSAATLARRMGLRRVRNLTEDDLLDMTYSADTAGISANVLDSFHLADLVMETTDAAGEINYIAVEISFTADGRDTVRAIRNAALLTRFTGKAAHAAVAGIYRDNRIQPQLESGEVVWHQLRQDDLEVD